VVQVEDVTGYTGWQKYLSVQQNGELVLEKQIVGKTGQEKKRWATRKCRTKAEGHNGGQGGEAPLKLTTCH